MWTRTEVLFWIANLLQDDDSRSWAFSTWVRTELVYSRFNHLSLGAFQRLRSVLQDLSDSAPVGRLLSWQHRMETVHVPVADEQVGELRQNHALILSPIPVPPLILYFPTSHLMFSASLIVFVFLSRTMMDNRYSGSFGTQTPRRLPLLDSVSTGSDSGIHHSHFVG